MEISKIKIPGVQDPLALKDNGAREELQDVADFVSDKERATAAALSDLNSKIGGEVAGKISEVLDFISEKELAISAAVNDINNKVGIPQYEAVDLGLPSGIKWANMNVGATSPEDTGLYFTWGSVEGFTKDSGRYCNGTYNGERDWSGPYLKEHGSELGDLVEVPVSDYFDAARKNMGAPWRIPTTDDMIELFNSTYTTWTWTQRNGMNGYLVVSKVNGNSIFLPAAGRFSSEFKDLGSRGHYWQSNVYDEMSGCVLDFNNTDVYAEDIGFGRYYSCSVRAVQD